MTALVDLQHQIARAVRGNDGEMPVGIIRPDHLPAGEPLSVYRNHHRISLSAVLGVTFPTVTLLIGEEAFRVLAWRFLQSSPPRQPCVSEYGAEFAGYLKTEPLVKGFPYLADIAMLDWAINQATIAPDVAALDADILGAMTPDQMTELSIKPHSSMTLLRSQFPLPDIYQLARSGEDAEGLSLDSGGAFLMVWRQLNAIKMIAVSQRAFEILGALANGELLASACEILLQTELPEFFSKYILTGAFARRP